MYPFSITLEGGKGVVSLSMKQKIILMHIEGKSQRSIAAELHKSRDAVSKYVSEYEEMKGILMEADPALDRDELIQTIVEKPKYDVSNRKPVKVTQDLEDAIENYLETNRKKRIAGRQKQVLSKYDIYEELVDQGYDISYSTIKRLIKEIDKRHEEAFIRQEYTPGDICEFDWGTAKLNIGEDGFKDYQMAVFTPAKSNYRFAVLYRAQDTAAFQQSHAEFFEHCGGTYQTMVYDNMKVAVKRFVGINEKEPTKALTELSIYYGFKFRFCNIAAGWEKGHVERSVEFVRRKAFRTKEKFDTLEDANRHLLQACLKMNSKPLSDGRISLEVFDVEKAHLGPNLPRFESCIAKEYRVCKYSTIIIYQNHYSVPDNLVGKMILAKVYTDKIIVYHEKDLVAVHSRNYQCHSWTIELKHYLKTLYKKPGALTNSTALLQADTKIKNIYENYYSKDAKIFLEVLEIIYEKGVDAVTFALKKLERISPLDMSAEKVRSICDHAKEQEAGARKEYTDDISKKSKEMLFLYTQLSGMKSKDGLEEAV